METALEKTTLPEAIKSDAATASVENKSSGAHIPTLVSVPTVLDSAIRQQKRAYESATSCLSAISEYVSSEQVEAQQLNERQQALTEKLTAMSQTLTGSEFTRFQEKLMRSGDDPTSPQAKEVMKEVLGTLKSTQAPKSTGLRNTLLVIFALLGALALADWQLSLNSTTYLQAKSDLVSQGGDFIHSAAQSILNPAPLIKP